MAKKRTTSPKPPTPSATTPRAGLTTERVLRLYQLLRLLGTPQKRESLTRRLRIDVRGFYRDLESLRLAGVAVTLIDGRYRLDQAVDAALQRLPFPDPQLTCGEAQTLAKGRTAAHRKLREQIERLLM
jgi:predicted DNA-binding transcriptional regulator YafY